jgi:hypothetical protein
VNIDKVSKVIYRQYLLHIIIKEKDYTMTTDNINLRGSGYKTPVLYYEFEDVFPEECCGNPEDCPEFISGACGGPKDAEES